MVTSGEDIQFFIFPSGGSTADFSPRYKAVRQMNLFLPLINKPGLLENNNTACDATVAAANSTYIGQNDDLNDWFKLSVGANSTISISLTGFETLAYIELRSGSNCSNTQIVQIASLPASSNPVIVQNVVEGEDYYVHIISTIPNGKTYAFNWTYATLLGELEPNNTACAATAAALGETYIGRDDDSQDWFAISVPTTSSIAMTVTGFAGTGVLQFFPIANTDCNTVGDTTPTAVSLTSAATAVGANNLLPGVYYARVLATANSGQAYIFMATVGTATLNSFEPNNTSCTALPINLDTQYQSFVNDNEDWYYIDLTANNSLNNGLAQLIITDVPTRSNTSYTQPNMRVEVEIWRSNSLTTTNPSCSDIRRLDSEGNWLNIRNRASKGNYWLEGVQELPSDRYYVRVFVRQDADTGANPPYPGPAYNITDPYKFWITRSASGVVSPRFYPGPCELCGGVFWGSEVPYYWWGMTGGTFSFQLLGRDCTGGGTKTCGCPQGANSGAVGATGEFGKGTYTSIGKGFYGLKVTYNGPAFSYTWTDEKPVKVQCEFGADIQVDEKGWPLTDPIAHPENFTSTP